MQSKEADRDRALLAAIVESSDDAIISKDLNSIITSWNRGAERLFGYTAEEAIGQSITMLIPHDRLAEETAIIEKIRRGERIEHYETVRQRKDGTLLDISLTISPLIDSHGQIIGASKIARDISALKRIMSALQEADRRKDAFLAVLAHELRNPLAPIRMGLELMKMAGNETAMLEEVRCTMERQTQQLITLVDDLMDMSRITQGKLELRKSRLQLADVIQGAVEASRPLIDEANHELSVDIPAQPLFLDADPSRLTQVFSNLLNNAAKYTPKGGRIWLRVKQQGSEVVVTVKDNGIGIPPDMLNHIFVMFSQLERPQIKSHSGLGIGLTLVKYLVEMHGGLIEVHSEGPNQGSTFVVRLPASPEKELPLDI